MATLPSENKICYKTFFGKLYYTDKKFFYGFAVFFIFLVGVPLFIHSDLTPFFRGWGLFKDPEYVQSIYPVIRIIANDSIDINKSELPGTNRTVIFAPVNFYVHMKQSGSDGQRVPFNRLANIVFPQYDKKVINSIQDTLAFQYWIKEYLSKTINKKVTSIQLFEDSISYNADGYVYIKKSHFLEKF